jgi:hypothetical protein
MGSGILQPSRGVRTSTKPYLDNYIKVISPRKYESKNDICERHGISEFRTYKDYRKNSDGTYRGGLSKPGVTWRCSLCWKEKKTANRRRNIGDASKEKKRKLIEYAGGSCKVCGYNRCLNAMHFHHKDPSTKNYEIAWGLRRFSLEKLRIEVNKCVLLCNRCHAELEEGMIQL